MRKRPGMSQFLLCLSGLGAVLQEGQWVGMGPGQAYVTPPGLPHAYRAVDAWRVLWVAYKPKRSLTNGVPHMVSVDDPIIEQAMDQTLIESQLRSEDHIVEAWLRILDTHVRRSVGSDQGPDALNQVWDMVLHDIAADWNIPDLAAELHISEEHFRRRCLERFGMSPIRYLCQLRMQYAENLLSSTEIKVADIAAQVGYQNPFAFATAFKRLYGCSPSAFRLAQT